MAGGVKSPLTECRGAVQFTRPAAAPLVLLAGAARTRVVPLSLWEECPTAVVKITPFQDDPLGNEIQQGFGLPGGVSVGRSVHKRKATFWATLKGHRRRETALPLAKNTSVATQQGPKPPYKNRSTPARFADSRQTAGRAFN